MTRHKHERAGGMFDRPWLLLTTTAGVLALSWILFVGSLHLHEMLVGLVVVALSTSFCARIYRSEKLPFAPRLRDLAQAWRIPHDIVRDTGILLSVLFRDLFLGEPAASLYRVCGFQASRRDPVIVAREALATAYTTMSPNMIVIGIDCTQGHLLFHQIRRDEVPQLARNLGAGQ